MFRKRLINLSKNDKNVLTYDLTLAIIAWIAVSGGCLATALSFGNCFEPRQASSFGRL